jgi:hypothetical protein
MDPTARVLDIREVTPALARELGMVNDAGAAVNANIQRHGVLHNGFRRQPTPEVDARLGLAAPRAASAYASPEHHMNTHYFHAANLLTTSNWPFGTGGGNDRGLPLALNNTFGYNLQPGDANPLAGQPRGTWMQISFGFNTFWINERGYQAPDDFLGLVLGGTGETMGDGFGAPHSFAAGANSTRGTEVPLAIYANAMGGYVWSQVAVRVMNDQQSSHNALVHQVNATMTALGYRVALEQAMRKQGATDATISGMTPLAEQLIRTGRPQGASTGNPYGGNAAILRPGLYTTTIAGANLNVLLDRAYIRHLSVANTGGIEGWAAPNFAEFQRNVLFAYAEGNNVAQAGEMGALRLERLRAVPLMEGIAPATAQAILDFVIATVVNNDVSGNHYNPNLLGHSSVGGTGKDRLPPTPVINRQ